MYEYEISVVCFSLLGYSLLIYYIFQWLIYSVFLYNPSPNIHTNHIATQTEHQPLFTDKYSKLLSQVHTITEELEESSQYTEVDAQSCVSSTDVNQLKHQLQLHQDLLTQLFDSQRQLKEKVRQLEAERNSINPNTLLQFYSLIQSPSNTPLGQCRFMNSISKQLILNQIKKLSQSKSIHSINLIYQFSKYTQPTTLSVLNNTPRLLAIFNLVDGKILTLCSTVSQGKGFLIDMRIKKVVRGELRHQYSQTSLLWSGIDPNLVIHFNDLETMVHLHENEEQINEEQKQINEEQKQINEQCNVDDQVSKLQESTPTLLLCDSNPSVLRKTKIINWQLYAVDV